MAFHKYVQVILGGQSRTRETRVLDKREQIQVKMAKH